MGSAMLRRSLAGLALSFALGGCGVGTQTEGVGVEDAVVTLPALPGGQGAAYFTLRRSGPPARLVSVSSPAFQRAELHSTMDHDGMTGMMPLGADQTRFSAAAPLVFAGGGKHAMLFGVDPALRPGARVRLTFQIEPGQPVTADAEVRGPGQVDASH
jgi:periplasmic copper chaperone A